MNGLANNSALQELLQELEQETPNYQKYTDFLNPSFEIISTMAYLVGVEQCVFDNPTRGKT